MIEDSEVLASVRQATGQFCTEFVEHPYLCYTEHGTHALFYAQLFNMLPEAARFTDWQGKKLGVIQKEYRTPTNLGRSKRQNWDIAVVKNPPSSDVHGAGSYDYLRLLAVVEFGLNEAIDHLEDDLQRLTHREANVENRFAVHLHRLSSPGGRTSGRDWSPRSRRIVSLADVVRLSGLYDVEVYYAMADSTGRRESGAWRIASGQEARIGG